MKKILASAGLVALGAANLQAVSTPGLAPQNTTKPFSVSAAVRGFYDDNYATVPNGPNRRDSFGLEVKPSVSLNWIKETTTLSAGYTFGMRYYADRVNNEIDYSHLFNVRLDHQFSERYRLSLYDEFVISQEPSLLNPAQQVQVLRVNGNNLRNTVGLDFTAQMTEHIALEPGYSYTLYDYKQRGPASYSATLDRDEHMFKIAARWIKMLERTDGLLGYQFNPIYHTSKDTLDPTGATFIDPKVRDTRSHFYFLGVDHSFTPELTANVRAGAQTVDYEGSRKTRTSPYVDVSGTYRFQESSSLQLGYKLSRITTDLIGFAAGNQGNLTVDQLAHFVYGRVNHRISDLTLSAGAQYQYGTFRGGTVNDQSEGFLTMDLSAAYQINPFLAAEAGYIFDMLKDQGWSGAGVASRDYHRNFIYIGLKGSY